MCGFQGSPPPPLPARPLYLPFNFNMTDTDETTCVGGRIKTSMIASDASKQAKPNKDLSTASKFKNGGAAAYWGYKAFQALRVRAFICVGVHAVLSTILNL